jgi:hypothetical protein
MCKISQEIKLFLEFGNVLCDKLLEFLIFKVHKMSKFLLAKHKTHFCQFLLFLQFFALWESVKICSFVQFKEFFCTIFLCLKISLPLGTLTFLDLVLRNIRKSNEL